MNNIRFGERPAGSQTMSPEIINATNYYRWIVSRMEKYLGQRILDIGGGFGTHLEFMLPDHPQITSIDLSETAVEFMRERFAAYPKFESAVLDFGQPGAQRELISRQYDTITSLNVLEHIEDDLTALSHMREILAAQHGNLFLFVPALPSLYGSLDSQAGHFRRYTRRSLASVLTKAGFEIVELYYFNVVGVLPWWFNAVVLRRDIAADSVGGQIRVFDRWIVPALRGVEALVHPPIGQSLIAVARA